MSGLEFSKPILVFDFESSGFVKSDNGDVTDIGDPTQLGALLLNPTTLKEESTFCSDIRCNPDRLIDWVLEHTDMTRDRAGSAPEPKEVAEKFLAQFSTDVYLASWNVSFDRRWLAQLMSSIGHNDSFYDYHHIDVWTLAYTYLAQRGKGDIIKSEQVFAEFGQSARGAHNALDDCRRTAEVLRTIVLPTGSPA